MKSKELKTYNLPVDNPVIAQIDAKPNFLFVIMIMIGMFSFIASFPKIYGVILIGFSICALIYMPRVLLMEFYNEYLVVYNKADKNNCVLIYYEDITSWYYSRGASHDYLYIELSDGRQEKIDAFSKSIFESNMNRFLKDKRRKSAQ
ncbi:MAG: hypothetical protein IKS54_03940 [Erysipelotrichaceae bacterium]|nr:hypothetical protein [Erysipelotrichaceae bacterium]